MTARVDTRLEQRAAAYVLGQLGAAERCRFERLLRRSEAAVQAVGAWQHRCAGLLATAEPLAPPDGLWLALQRALPSAQPGDEEPAGV